MNPYRMFLTPITERILHVFEGTVWNRKGAAKNELRDCSKQGSGDISSSCIMDGIVFSWWETIGMPTIMPHRPAAKHVRKSLRGRFGERDSIIADE